MSDRINLDFIKNEIGNDPMVITEMLVIFQDVLTEFEDSLTNGIEEQSYTTIFIATHKIKPSLKMFGLHKLISLTTILERSVKDEIDFSSIKKQFRDVQIPLPTIHSEVKELLLKYDK